MPNYRVYNSTTKKWEDTGIAFRSDLDAYAKKETGVYFVEGNTTGTAGTWTGTNDNITSLYDGLVVNYKIGIAGASTTKLNINNLGAKICYLRGTSKLTTHYAVGTMVLLSYNKTKDAFYAADYDSDAYTIRQYYNVTDELEYPLIYSYNTDVSGTTTYKATYGAVKSGFTFNPSTDTLSVTKLKLNGTEVDLSKYALTTSLSSYATTTALSNLQQGLETGDIVVEEANIATKATKDGNGNKIVDTYATKTDLNSYLTTTDASSTYATKSSLSSYIPTSKLAVANGVATLDNTGKVPSSQLPSYVDDVLEGYIGNEGASFYKDSAKTTSYTPEGGKIYVDVESGRTYRWSGSSYVEISASLALGVTSSTAYSGAKGKANADNIAILQGYFTDGKANSAASADQAEYDSDGNVISETYANKKNGIYYTQGASTDTTTSWTGVLLGVDTAYVGLTIAFKTSKASASGLKLTLYKDSAKTQQLVSASVYRNNSAITSHVVANSVVILVYDGTYWRWTDYDANSYAYVRQVTTADNANYPMLFAYETTLPASYDTKYTRKAANFTYNPSTKTLSVDNMSIDTLYATGRIETEGTIFAEGDIESESNLYVSGQVTCDELCSNTMYVGENDDLVYDGTNFTLNGNDIYHAGNLDVDNLAKLDTANTFTVGQKITRTDSGAILELESAASDTNFLLKRTSGATCVLEAGSGVGLFGTKSNHSLQIRTNYTNRMTFDTSGGVTLATDVAATSNSNQLATTKWVKALGYVTSDAIPSAVTESTVSGWGFTRNAGTVTKVKVGTSEYSPASGVISLPAYPSVSNPTTTNIFNTPTTLTNPSQGALTTSSILTFSSSLQAGDKVKAYFSGETSNTSAASYQAGLVEFEVFAAPNNAIVGSGSFMSNTGAQALIITIQVVSSTQFKVSLYGLNANSYAAMAKVNLLKVERVR